MANKPETPEPFSLKRWSQRKRAAGKTPPAQTLPPPAAEAPAAIAVADSASAAVPEPSPPLPPVDSLTFDSDYSAFMQPKIAEETRRAALRKLFSDPSFNVMDGLDIYVGDYTQSDPMPSGMLEKLSAAYAMLDPVEPARDARTDAASPVPAGDAAPAPISDTREEVAAESPAEPAQSPSGTAVGDTPTQSGRA